jgi:hypothetical protein
MFALLPLLALIGVPYITLTANKKADFVLGG